MDNQVVYLTLLYGGLLFVLTATIWIFVRAFRKQTIEYPKQIVVTVRGKRDYTRHPREKVQKIYGVLVVILSCGLLGWFISPLAMKLITGHSPSDAEYLCIGSARRGYQPRAVVGKRANTEYIGNGIYHTTGTLSVKSIDSLRNHYTATIHFSCTTHYTRREGWKFLDKSKE